MFIDYAAGGRFGSAGGLGHFSRFAVPLWSSVSEFPCYNFGKLVASAFLSQTGCKEEVVFPGFKFLPFTQFVQCLEPSLLLVC
jgi:hypothetical protein